MSILNSTTSQNGANFIHHLTLDCGGITTSLGTVDKEKYLSSRQTKVLQAV